MPVSDPPSSSSDSISLQALRKLRMARTEKAVNDHTNPKNETLHTTTVINNITRTVLGINLAMAQLNAFMNNNEAITAFRQNISTRRYLFKPLPLPIASSLSFIKAWTQRNTTIDPPKTPNCRTEDVTTMYLRRQTKSKIGTHKQRLAMRLTLKNVVVKCDVLEAGRLRFDNHTVKSSCTADKNNTHWLYGGVCAQPHMSSGV